MTPRSTTLAVVILSFLGSAWAAPHFIVRQTALTRTRLDPILSSGEIASHVHVFAGSSAVTADMTSASASGEGTCTTSPISADKSGYWVPQLYYKHRDGKFSAISGEGLVTYWLDHSSAGEELTSVNEDFRMVAGDTKRTSSDQTIPSNAAVSFQCFGSGYDKKHPNIPQDTDCETIRPQITFPNCWNGKDSFLKDGSHVKYPTGNPETGPCPTGYKRIPTLFIESWYNPKALLGADYEWYPGCLVFANGDNFGNTFHADWMNGFPKTLLVDAFKACPSMFGKHTECPTLNKFTQSAQASDCQMKGDIVNEAVGIQTPLAKLPGNNPEFSSSGKTSTPNSSYKESGSVIAFSAGIGGDCKSGKCTDYAGGSGSGSSSKGAAAPAAVPSKSTTSKAAAKGSSAAGTSKAAVKSAGAATGAAAAPPVAVAVAPSADSAPVAAAQPTPVRVAPGTARGGRPTRYKRRLPARQTVGY